MTPTPFRYSVPRALAGLALALLALRPAGAAVLTVSNTKDSGPGSYRAALQAANLAPGATIRFHIPATDPGFAGGVFTIKPHTYLPKIAAAGTVIDGATQTAFTGNTSPSGPEVVLNGGVGGPNSAGVDLGASQCSVKGLVIQAFQIGVVIEGNSTQGCSVKGCYIGTNAAGTAAAANSYEGLDLMGPHNCQIGGTNAADGNVISGNVGHGVWLSGASNTLVGNRIGTNAGGTAKLGNTFDGVVIQGQGNTVSDNLVSGNGRAGVRLNVSGAHGNRLVSNKIGTDTTGKLALPNGADGVSLEGGAHDNVIGDGTTPGRNVISGNLGNGVIISGPSTDHNTLLRNYIGTTVGGEHALKNANDGVRIAAQAKQNQIGQSSPNVYKQNLISGNGYCGIEIDGAGTEANVLEGNRIGTDVVGGYYSLPNGNVGVFVHGYAGKNLIGGPSGHGNLISGNTHDGVLITENGTMYNVVQSNMIGGNDPYAVGYTGYQIPNGGNGITVRSASHTTLRGNQIGGNKGSGIYVSGEILYGYPYAATDVQIQSNHVGVSSFSQRMPNGLDGITIDEDVNHSDIGGIHVGLWNGEPYDTDGNIVSANVRDGIRIGGVRTHDITISGNYVGDDPPQGYVPNGGDGVHLLGGYNLSFDGDLGKTGNIIAANKGNGIAVEHAAYVSIYGCTIGLEDDYTTPVPNAKHGISIANGAAHVSIGYDHVEGINRICSNKGDGVYLGPGVTDVLFGGNIIGRDPDHDDTRLGNKGHGIEVDGASRVEMDWKPTPVTVAGNSGDGILVKGAATGVTFRYVSVWDNDGVQINLQPAGEPAHTLTPNDDLDPDDGPNRLQNYPYLDVAFQLNGVTRVLGSLHSTPNQQFRLDFYSSPARDASGHANAQTWRLELLASTDASGQARFSVDLPLLANGHTVAVTATRVQTGDTSELSPAVTIGAPGTPDN